MYGDFVQIESENISCLISFVGASLAGLKEKNSGEELSMSDGVVLLEQECNGHDFSQDVFELLEIEKGEGFTKAVFECCKFDEDIKVTYTLKDGGAKPVEIEKRICG